MGEQALGFGAVVLFLALAVWLWKRESVKRELGERERLQDEKDHERNQKANAEFLEKGKERQDALDRFNPADPWGGLRKNRPD